MAYKETLQKFLGTLGGNEGEECHLTKASKLNFHLSADASFDRKLLLDWLTPNFLYVGGNVYSYTLLGNNN